MAKKFLNSIDLASTELRNALIQVLASDPGSPANGQVWVNSTSWTLNVRLNGVTIPLGRIDQLAAPTADVAWGSHKITSLLDPTSAQDAATKNYVDAVAAGARDWKDSARAASTANVAVTYTATGGTSGRGQITAAPNTLDGVTLVAGNRVLLKNQTTPAQNGIYVVTTLGTGANGVWDRATDFDQDSEVTAGVVIPVEEGTTNDNTAWMLATNNPITIGGASGTSLTFIQFGGGGAGTVTSFAQDIGDGSTTSIAVTHSLGSQDVIVQVYQKSDGAQVEPDIIRTSTSVVTLVFAAAPTTAQYRVVVHK